MISKRIKKKYYLKKKLIPSEEHMAFTFTVRKKKL